MVEPGDQSTNMEFVGDKKKEAPEKVTFQLHHLIFDKFTITMHCNDTIRMQMMNRVKDQ